MMRVRMNAPSMTSRSQTVKAIKPQWHEKSSLFAPAPTFAERNTKPRTAVEAVSAPDSAFLEGVMIDDIQDALKGDLKAIYATPKIHPLNL